MASFDAYLSSAEREQLDTLKQRYTLNEQRLVVSRANLAIINAISAARQGYPGTYNQDSNSVTWSVGTKEVLGLSQSDTFESRDWGTVFITGKQNFYNNFIKDTVKDQENVSSELKDLNEQLSKKYSTSVAVANKVENINAEKLGSAMALNSTIIVIGLIIAYIFYNKHKRK